MNGSNRRNGAAQLLRRTHGPKHVAQMEKEEEAQLLGHGLVGKTGPQDILLAGRMHGKIGSPMRSPRNKTHTHRVATNGSSTTKRGGNPHPGMTAAQPQAGKRRANRQGATPNGASTTGVTRAGGAATGEENKGGEPTQGTLNSFDFIWQWNLSISSLQREATVGY